MKRVLSALLICCLFFNPMSVYAAPLANISEECQKISEPELQRELNKIIGQAFEAQSIDFPLIVNQEWNHLKLDQTVDLAIDTALEKVKNRSNSWNKFQTNWSKEKIVKFSEDVTQQALNSKELTTALNQLSINISRKTADKLATIAQTSVDLGLNCLFRFIGNEYSEEIEDFFTEKTIESLPNSGELSELNPNLDPQNFITPKNLTGGIIIISSVLVKQAGKGIVRRVLVQLGERILGRLGTSVIPFVGELIGGGLIISDLIHSKDGALPEIQKALKQPQIKTEFKTVIANTLDEEITQQNSLISRELALSIYSKWTDFKINYQQMLKLYNQLPEFKTMVNNYGTNQEEITVITELLAKSHKNLTDNQILAAIKDGRFEEALYLPQTSYKILEDYTLDDLILWVNVAGSKINKVINLELYKHLPVQEIDKTFLANLLAIPDELTISKLSLLKIDMIRQLLKISKFQLVSLSQHLSANDLEQLGSQLKDLNQTEINSLIRGLLEDKSMLKVLDHIVQSVNIDRAIQVWKTNNQFWSLSTIHNICSVVRGAVSYKLLIDKYGNIILIVPFLILLISILAIFYLFSFIRAILPQKN